MQQFRRSAQQFHGASGQGTSRPKRRFPDRNILHENQSLVQGWRRSDLQPRSCHLWHRACRQRFAAGYSCRLRYVLQFRLQIPALLSGLCAIMLRIPNDDDDPSRLRAPCHAGYSTHDKIWRGQLPLSPGVSLNQPLIVIERCRMSVSTFEILASRWKSMQPQLILKATKIEGESIYPQEARLESTR